MKKGFGLIYAIMTTLILSLIAVGFIVVAKFSTATSTQTTSALKTYWAAESASNYNINWWINLPDDVRKLWNTALYTIETETKGSKVQYKDSDLESFDVSKMPEMKGKIDGNTIWKHASSLETPSILEIDGKQVKLMRYKAPRAGKPDQAVWVLDSYAYDPETGAVNEIMISNVYNFLTTNNIGWLDYAEALNHSMYGTGINSRKGIYYEWDFRHGQCYFNDLIRFDYKSSSSKKGPTFYGRFHSASKDESRYGASVDNPKLFTNLATTSYPYGIFVEATGKLNQASAIGLLNTSLFGGYERVESMSPENVVWSWQEVVELGPENGVYFLDGDDFTAGSYINIRTKVTGGQTFIDIFASADTTGTPVVENLPANKYNTVAVEGIYGDVGIQGVSNTDFTVVTQSNNIHINGDFYLKEMETAKTNLEDYDQDDLESPSESMLDALSDAMTNAATRPKGHLSLIACLDSSSESTIKRENVFFINSMETLFLTAALLSYNGDVAAGPKIGTSNNNSTNFYNIGSVIILDTQEETTGSNSSKFPYVLVQDKRYLDPNEPVPPVWGEIPGNTTTETEKGLNPGHGWHKYNYGQVNSDKFDQIVKRYITFN